MPASPALLIDPRPCPPSRAVLLGPDGTVLRRAERSSFTRMSVARLGPDGQPDLELGAIELGGGAMTTVTGPEDPCPVGCVDLTRPPPTVHLTLRQVDPALVGLMTGGLVVAGGRP